MKKISLFYELLIGREEKAQHIVSFLKSFDIFYNCNVMCKI